MISQRYLLNFYHFDSETKRRWFLSELCLLHNCWVFTALLKWALNVFK